MQSCATPAPVSAVLDIPAGRIRIIAAARAVTTVEIRPVLNIHATTAHGDIARSR